MADNDREQFNYEAAFEQTVKRRLPTVPTLYRPNYLRVLGGEASPRQAIKAMCMECQGYDRSAVAECTSPACPLYVHRPFKDPATVFPRSVAALAKVTNQQQEAA